MRKIGKRGKIGWVAAAMVCASLLFTACQGGNAGDTTENRGGVENESKAEHGSGTENGSGTEHRETEETDMAPVKRPREETTEASAEEESGNVFPGSYAIPEGWVKAEKYSTDEMFFYVEEGHEEDRQPDNISINVGKNRYPADSHEEFREAILRQIMMQISGQEGVNLYGDGTHTEQGYILYIFTIEEEEEGITTKQYYIVDDYRFCLIQLTNFTGSESADEAAREMADSFVWAEDGEG